MQVVALELENEGMRRFGTTTKKNQTKKTISPNSCLMFRTGRAWILARHGLKLFHCLKCFEMLRFQLPNKKRREIGLENEIFSACMPRQQCLQPSAGLRLIDWLTDRLTQTAGSNDVLCTARLEEWRNWRQCAQVRPESQSEDRE